MAAYKPKVGRTVEFFTLSRSFQAREIGTGPYAALVLQVFDNGECHLGVWSPYRAPFLMPAVPLGSPDNLRREGSDEEVTHWWQPIS
jgi:hypothetical protein